MADLAYLHGRTVPEKRGSLVTEMSHNMNLDEERNLESLKIDKDANIKYIMSMKQYQAYWNTLGLPPAINTLNWGLLGIGGFMKSIGTS